MAIETIDITMTDPAARMPKQGTEGSAGMDLYSIQSINIPPGQRHPIATGVNLHLPPHLAGFIWPRSGLAVHEGAMVMAGLIDPDYRGEIKVVIYNAGHTDLEIREGDRVGQLVIQPFVMPELREVPRLDSNTQRGTQGFGSTGKK